MKCPRCQQDTDDGCCIRCGILYTKRYFDPKLVPKDHFSRTTPLGKLSAEYKIGSSWRNVLPTFGIAKSTWNDLGDVWTQHEWRITSDEG